MWPFAKARTETRSAMSGFTAELMAARESYISGRRGIAELTGTVQAAVSLWEGGLGLADVVGAEMLSRACMALTARSLALRGEAVFLIRENGLVPCADWDLSTRDGQPTAYRVSISEAGGGRSKTVLAGEVLHFRIGCDVAAPYHGSAPLKRAQLTAGLLNAVEQALAEVYELAPIGSQIMPMPEMPSTDMQGLSRELRGNRGKVLIRESVNVAAAGGPGPVQDWKAADITPDISRVMPKESLEAARGAINAVFGVLPALNSPAATGPLVREAQRHLAQWTLQPIAAALAEEASRKLGTEVAIDVMRPLQAYDAGGRARALKSVVETLALAKEAGVDTDTALKLVDWQDD